MKEILRKLYNKNKYIKGMNRLRKGLTPVYIEYDITFKPRWDEESGNPYLAKIISNAENNYIASLQQIASYKPIIEKINENQLPFSSTQWRNHQIPALDGFSVMRAALNAKSTYMEVGSGYSTLFAKSALIYQEKNTKVISIDPMPRTEISAVCDEIISNPLEDVDLTIFDNLKPGDSLFIDNSHRSFMNSDVTVFMLDVLPRLKPGVLVGIHDIFLPYDYFESWSERGYNEQYLLGSYLLSNPNYFDTQLANYWICKNNMHRECLKDIWALLDDDICNRPASAFWGIKQ